MNEAGSILLFLGPDSGSESESDAEEWVEDAHHAAARESERNSVLLCAQCNKVFSSRRHLKIHYTKLHKGGNHAAEMGRARRSRHFNRHLCSVCLKHFADEWTLRHHARTVHLAQREHSCRECGKAFLSHKDVKRHFLGVHLREKITFPGRLASSVKATAKKQKSARSASSACLRQRSRRVKNPDAGNQLGSQERRLDNADNITAVSNTGIPGTDSGRLNHLHSSLGHSEEADDRQAEDPGPLLSTGAGMVASVVNSDRQLVATEQSGRKVKLPRVNLPSDKQSGRPLKISCLLPPPPPPPPICNQREKCAMPSVGDAVASPQRGEQEEEEDLPLFELENLENLQLVLSEGSCDAELVIPEGGLPVRLQLSSSQLNPSLAIKIDELSQSCAALNRHVEAGPVSPVPSQPESMFSNVMSDDEDAIVASSYVQAVLSSTSNPSLAADGDEEKEAGEEAVEEDRTCLRLVQIVPPILQHAGNRRPLLTSSGARSQGKVRLKVIGRNSGNRGVGVLDCSSHVEFDVSLSKTCPHCGRLYLSQMYLQRHLDSAHPTTSALLPDAAALTPSLAFRGSSVIRKSGKVVQQSTSPPLTPVSSSLSGSQQDMQASRLTAASGQSSGQKLIVASGKSNSQNLSAAMGNLSCQQPTAAPRESRSPQLTAAHSLFNCQPRTSSVHSSQELTTALRQACRQQLTTVASGSGSRQLTTVTENDVQELTTALGQSCSQQLTTVMDLSGQEIATTAGSHSSSQQLTLTYSQPGCEQQTAALTQSICGELTLSLSSCEDCGKEFKTKALLTKHRKQEHKVRLALACSYCDKTFSSEQSRRLHSQSAHQGVRTICNICLKPVLDLPRHVRLQHKHPEERPQACNLCPLRFKTLFALERHRAAVHQQLRPWPCPLCEKRFGAKRDAARHQLLVHMGGGVGTASGRRGYSCPLCGSGFKLRREYEAHRAQEHVNLSEEEVIQLIHAEFDGRAHVSNQL